MMKKEEFTEKVEQLFSERLDQYWSNPRINSVGGIESPTDGDVNHWYIEAFLEAALEAGIAVEEYRDDSDSCYHAVTLKLKAAGLELRYVDCVCGGHGPRNAELVTEP